MDRATLRHGEPVRNLQHFLRRISYHYNTVSAVVPDGIFSVQTHESVKDFQKTFGMEPSGTVDQNTWEKIIQVHDSILKAYGPTRKISLIPNAGTKIMPGDETDLLFAIQSMMFVISERFSNIPSLEICGVHNEPSVKSTVAIQKVCGLQQSGAIDRFTYDMIVTIYADFIIGFDREVLGSNTLGLENIALMSQV